MKKIISAALAITLFICAAQAQTTERGNRHQKGERKEKTFDKLNLTAEQKEKFQSLRQAQKKEMDALRQSGNVTPEQRKDIHKKYKTQYENILTPAQREEMNKQKSGWKDKGAKRKGAGNRDDKAGTQAAFFKKKLNLTAAQQTKLTSLFQEFRTKTKDIRSSNSLTQDQKKTQIKSLEEQYMMQGKALLTPEQAKKFEEMKGKRINRRNSNV